MRTLKRTSLRLVLVAVPALVALPVVVHTAETPPTQAAPQREKGIPPDADDILRRMTDYLASLQSFTVQSASVDEVVLKNGQKIQLASESLVSVKRPNRLQSEQIGTADKGMAFWYDGKTMSLYCKATNTYGSAPAPPTLDAMIDAARKQFQIEAPGADLLFSHPYEILTEQVTGGRVIGRETVDGAAANHLAFAGEDVDWQIWVQEGPRPLPLRFVITTKTMKEQPEFTVRLSHWDPQATLADATFAFQPPPGSKHVDSLPASCGASP
jgi:hypothetical protein